MFGFKKSHSPDGTVRNWSRYPYSLTVFENIRGQQWRTAMFHHATWPLAVHVSWLNWALYVSVKRNNRTLFSAIA